ncbi:MAG: MarR family transcriptional regulator [Anaerolineae bacterium]|nr:MarR family transcriptional regulator [Anaerolineae bacterium]
MLFQLLEILNRSDRLHTPPQLAEALHTTPQMVQQLTEHLARQGYLVEAPQCSDGCADCALRAMCSAEGHKAKLWTVTEKGLRALHRSGGAP